jgi:hypothetical protein
LALRVIDTEQHATSIRMPRRDPNGKLALAQKPNNASAQKPGSAENGDNAPSHGLSAVASSTDWQKSGVTGSRARRAPGDAAGAMIAARAPHDML